MEPCAKNPNAKQVFSSGSIASHSQVSTMPDTKLWSLSLLSRIVSAIHGRVGGGASMDQSHRRRSAAPLYKMLEQVSGAGASIRRFALAGSYGTSWTAMVDAGTEPSFRMMCRWPLPGSTSVGAGCPGTNVYT